MRAGASVPDTARMCSTRPVHTACNVQRTGLCSMQHAANIMQHATHSMNNAQHCSVQRTALCRIAPAQLDLELRDARGLRRGHTAQLRERLRAVGCAQAYTERTTAQRSMRVPLRCSAHRSGRMPRTTRRANREGPA